MECPLAMSSVCLLIFYFDTDPPTQGTDQGAQEQVDTEHGPAAQQALGPRVPSPPHGSQRLVDGGPRAGTRLRGSAWRGTSSQLRVARHVFAASRGEARLRSSTRRGTSPSLRPDYPWCGGNPWGWFRPGERPSRPKYGMVISGLVPPVPATRRRTIPPSSTWSLPGRGPLLAIVLAAAAGSRLATGQIRVFA